MTRQETNKSKLVYPQLRERASAQHKWGTLSVHKGTASKCQTDDNLAVNLQQAISLMTNQLKREGEKLTCLKLSPKHKITALHQQPLCAYLLLLNLKCHLIFLSRAAIVKF